ncbi:hypothetical protein JG688_00015387, partial [Phytophthora aleatoria]
VALLALAKRERRYLHTKLRGTRLVLCLELSDRPSREPFQPEGSYKCPGNGTVVDDDIDTCARFIN